MNLPELPTNQYWRLDKVNGDWYGDYFRLSIIENVPHTFINWLRTAGEYKKVVVARAIEDEDVSEDKLPQRAYSLLIDYQKAKNRETLIGDYK